MKPAWAETRQTYPLLLMAPESSSQLWNGGEEAEEAEEAEGEEDWDVLLIRQGVCPREICYDFLFFLLRRLLFFFFFVE